MDAHHRASPAVSCLSLSVSETGISLDPGRGTSAGRQEQEREDQGGHGKIGDYCHGTGIIRALAGQEFKANGPERIRLTAVEENLMMRRMSQNDHRPYPGEGKAAAASTSSGRSFSEKILDLYSHRKSYIMPYIGAHFETVVPHAFRVAVIGLNAYVSDQEMQKANPDWFAGWFRAVNIGKTHRFFKTAYVEAERLASALCGNGIFTGLRWDTDPQAKRGFYVTNAAKAFLPESGYKTDANVAPVIREHLPQWHAELDLMAEYGTLPHLIVVLGEKAWEGMWQSLNVKCKDTFPSYRHFRVVAYQSGYDDYFHWSGRAELADGHRIILARVHHPARPGRSRTAKWLLGRQEFQRLVDGE